MKKVRINAIFNILLFFVFLTSCFSGLVLWLGRGTLLKQVLFGLTRQNWRDVHNYSSLVFMFLILVHLVLCWDYIKDLPKLIKGRKK